MLLCQFRGFVRACAANKLVPRGAVLRSRQFASTAAKDDFFFEQNAWKQKLSGSKIVYFGERHDQPAVLRAQIATLEAWAPSVLASLVLEMFTVEQQDLLDKWGTYSRKEQNDLYHSTGGEFDIEHYRQLVDAAKVAGMRVLAGFPSRKEARAVCRAPPDAVELTKMHGMHGLLGHGAADHFRLFAGMLSGKHLSELDNDAELPQRGRQIFPAQCWKDLVCADVVFNASRAGPVMVIAGCGHTDFSLGIPQRVSALQNQYKLASQELSQCIVTAREIGEDFTETFRGRCIADIVLRYQPSAFDFEA